MRHLMTREEMKQYKSIGFEIVYFPIGESSHGGDSIIIRFGHLLRSKPEQKIIVIDGGYASDGESVYKFIKNDLNSNKIDLVISTHPDEDHTSGLRTLIESDILVDKILMHRPWRNTEIDSSLFADGRKTDISINEEFKEAFKYAYEIERIVLEKYGHDRLIIEPKVGMEFFDGALTILGPEKELYISKILESSKTSDPAEYTGVKTESGRSSSTKFGTETLDSPLPWPNDPTTSAINDTSIISLFNFANRRILFTGDSGLQGLCNAFEYAVHLNLDLKKIDVLDIPHHGSRKNINPKFISYLQPKMAFLSAPKKNDRNHPSQKLINEFVRQGIKVYSTQGKTLFWGENKPNRGLSSLSSLEFNEKIDL
jgi:beta-lactamase superfamily II metal-dependent hydrolase